MTYLAPLDPPVAIDGSLQVFNVKLGGWVKGPQINGTFVSPAGDWLRPMPLGVQAVSKMVELKAGDGAYVKYDVFVVR